LCGCAGVGVGVHVCACRHEGVGVGVGMVVGVGVCVYKTCLEWFGYYIAQVNCTCQTRANELRPIRPAF